MAPKSNAIRWRSSWISLSSAPELLDCDFWSLDALDPLDFTAFSWDFREVSAKRTCRNQLLFPKGLAGQKSVLLGFVWPICGFKLSLNYLSTIFLGQKFEQALWTLGTLLKLSVSQTFDPHIHSLNAQGWTELFAVCPGNGGDNVSTCSLALGDIRKAKLYIL